MDTLTDAPTYSTQELVELLGLTYRVVDRWARERVLVPAVEARGSGSRRVYTADQVLVAAALQELDRLGASYPVLEAAARELERARWDRPLALDPTGRVPSPGVVPAAYHLDLRLVRARVDVAALDRLGY